MTKIISYTYSFLLFIFNFQYIYAEEFNANSQLSSARRHSCSIDNNGSVFCWGDNNHKQLGNKHADSNIPVKVNSIQNAVYVAAGSYHSCAVIKTGNVYCWGLNNFGQLGIEKNPKALEQPDAVKIENLDNVISVSLGEVHSCALTKTGDVFCWGDNSEGQLSSKKVKETHVPTKISALSKVTMIATGTNHTCALDNNGMVYCWGDNKSWQIGGNRVEDISPVTPVSNLRNIRNISAGGMTSCAVSSLGEVYCWGENTLGQAGLINTTDEPNPKVKIPYKIDMPKRADSVSVGEYHTCILSVVKTVYCWGNNSTDNYQVGVVSSDPHIPIPTRVPNLLNIKLISSGGLHTCALNKEGEIHCWGNNFQGQVGNGTFSKSELRPSKVTLISSRKIKNNQFYIACYHYLWNSNILNEKIEDFFAQNAKINYDWGIESKEKSTEYFIAEGQVEDGFLIDSKNGYNKIIESCHDIISLRNKSLKDGDVYRLYDIKAVFSEDEEKEFPISFFNPNNTDKLKRIVIFGDSLSDTGNLKQFIHIFPGKPYFKGRFSNGFNWTDYFKFNTEVSILNYAYGGAKSKTDTQVSPANVISFIKSNIRNFITGGMTGYVEDYSANRIKKTQNQSVNTVRASDETLYIIWIGGNDYLDSITSKSRVLNFLQDTQNKVAHSVVSNIFHAIEELKDHGARNFLVISVPNVSFTPEVVMNKNLDLTEGMYSDKQKIFARINEIVDFNNTLLKNKIDEYVSNHQNLRINYLDINPYLFKLYNNIHLTESGYFDYEIKNLNSEYSFNRLENKNIQLPCYTGGFKRIQFFSSNSLSSDLFCNDMNNVYQTKAMFWDMVHPTTYTHCFLSYAIQNHIASLRLMSKPKKTLAEHKKYCASWDFEKK